MRRFLLGSLLVFGCTKDITKDVEDLAERACACAGKKDKACASTTLAEMVKLSSEARHIKGDEQRMAAAAKRMGECWLTAGVTSLEIAEAVNQIPKKPDPTKPPEAPAPAPEAPAP
jgi:hypothetical protein